MIALLIHRGSIEGLRTHRISRFILGSEGSELGSMLRNRAPVPAKGTGAQKKCTASPLILGIFFAPCGNQE